MLALPTGHPFLNVQRTRYWTMTGVAADPTYAFVQSLDTSSGIVAEPRSWDNPSWCVRAPGVVTSQ